MVIQHNLMAMNAQRQFGIVDKKKTTSMERLSSGYRINRSADDAAGLSISEKMRRQIRGLNQASRNMQDGVSFAQVADGALNEVHDMMQRMNELAVKAANGTLSTEDRKMVDEEVGELKQELQRTFRDTEFNEIKIFRGYYVPEITGAPEDIQVFMTDENTYGGVAINNIRYTWAELADKGLRFQEDGTFAENSIRFQTWDGEEVILETEKGAAPNAISRKYGWKANDNGIYVNNVLATTWDDLGLDPSAIEAKEYSFAFHGMDISFAVEADDHTLEDVIAAINGDQLNYTTWNTVPSYVVRQQAADIKEQPQTFGLTNSNLALYLSPNMKLVASEEGIRLTADNVFEYTEEAWGDFRDDTLAGQTAQGAYGTSSNQGYPIVDWGLDKDSNRESDITFDDKAVYRYRDDSLTGFTVDFSLADETSKAAARKALSVDVKRTVTAPTTTSAIESNADRTMSVAFGLPSYSIRFQEMMGRNFADADDTCLTQMAAELDGDRYKLTFSLGFDEAHMQEYTGSMTAEALREAVIGGTPLRITLENTSEELEDGLDDKLVGVRDADRQVTVTLSTVKYQGDPNDSSLRQQYVDKALELLNGAKPVVKAQDSAKVTMSVTEAGAGSNETNFGVIVNPPMKRLDIQAGAESGQHIEMQWSPLSLGIVGLGATNVLTAEAAGGAIEELKNAMRIVSEERAAFGAYQNRMEHAIKNVNNISENTTAAESLIRDADMSEEAVNLSVHHILSQAANSVLSQANQSAQGVLNLMQ